MGSRGFCGWIVCESDGDFTAFEEVQRLTTADGQHFDSDARLALVCGQDRGQQTRVLDARRRGRVALRRSGPTGTPTPPRSTGSRAHVRRAAFSRRFPSSGLTLSKHHSEYSVRAATNVKAGGGSGSSGPTFRFF